MVVSLYSDVRGYFCNLLHRFSVEGVGKFRGALGCVVVNLWVFCRCLSVFLRRDFFACTILQWFLCYGVNVSVYSLFVVSIVRVVYFVVSELNVFLVSCGVVYILSSIWVLLVDCVSFCRHFTV